MITINNTSYIGLDGYSGLPSISAVVVGKIGHRFPFRLTEDAKAWVPNYPSIWNNGIWTVFMPESKSDGNR